MFYTLKLHKGRSTLGPYSQGAYICNKYIIKRNQNKNRGNVILGKVVYEDLSDQMRFTLSRDIHKVMGNP